jgi:hypothetical protein
MNSICTKEPILTWERKNCLHQDVYRRPVLCDNLRCKNNVSIYASLKALCSGKFYTQRPAGYLRLTRQLSMCSRARIRTGAKKGSPCPAHPRDCPPFSLSRTPKAKGIEKTLSFRAVEEAQVAVPADGNEVDEQDAVRQRDKLEVDELHKGPDEVIGLQGGQVALVQLLLGAAALHDGHAAQEDADEGGREQALVAGHPGQDLGVLVLEHHLVLQEAEPGRRRGAEDGWCMVLVCM